MTIDFTKNNGLIPAIIQDVDTKNVLMLGYMDLEAYLKTKKTGKVHFYSRSKERLWMKGEKSQNYLNVISIENDCDQDTFLIKVRPDGPTCHLGTDTCWREKNESTYGFLTVLEDVITERKENKSETSYTASLFKKGINKIAQKVGEEAVELVIEAKDNNKQRFLNESADLLYHYLILLQEKGFKLDDVVKALSDRHQKEDKG